MTVAALVCAALAAWASGGSLTVLPFQSGGPRAGLLPSLLWLAIAIVAALILTRTLSPAAGKRARVWLLSALVLLPWLPVRIPSSFLIWVGPIRFWVLAILAIATTVSTLAQRAPPLLRAAAADPRRAPWLAGAVAESLYVAGAWAVSPHLPAGDEPHYLVITQSLLNDGDLKVENNYLRREYREYYAGDLQPHYLRRGLNQAIYSIHAPGLPAVVAPVFALFGYPGVIVFLALASAAATALTWTTVWRVTRDVAASWFGWSAVALSAPFFFQAFTVYPDAPGGALLMVTVLALVSDDEPSTAYLVACGASLALLPWLHTRFALLAATAGLALALRAMRAERPVRRIAALLAVPAISALTWFAFFYVVYGTIDPSAPYNGYTQTSWANLGRGVPGLLLDQQFGLLPNAPVYLCAALGLVPLARRSPRLAAELTAIAVPYVLAVAAYQMWWAGYSSPARFLTPILLPLAIPAGLWFAALRSWAARMLGLTASRQPADHGDGRNSRARVAALQHARRGFAPARLDVAARQPHDRHAQPLSEFTARRACARPGVAARDRDDDGGGDIRGTRTPQAIDGDSDDRRRRRGISDVRALGCVAKQRSGTVDASERQRVAPP